MIGMAPYAQLAIMEGIGQHLPARLTMMQLVAGQTNQGVARTGLGSHVLDRLPLYL
jgi:hypothetical protein